MNAETQKLLASDKKHLWHPFTQMKQWNQNPQTVIESAKGFHLFDTEGNKYIDAFSSLWCNVHGHQVSAIDNAINAQMKMVSHSTLLGLAQNRSIELAEKLTSIVPNNLQKVFYSDSGATAVEIAIKIAYQYWANIGQNERTNFISLKNAYHGDTIGSVSVGGMDLFHGKFRSLLFETYFAPTPNPYRYNGCADDCAQKTLDTIEHILKTKPNEIAAIVVEPLIQGAAGIIVHPSGFLKKVSDLAKKYNTLLIVDEVAMGFGKTGKMFACQHEDVSPDIMCLGKGITGGYLPLAATLTTNKIYDAFLGGIDEFKTFYHGHTYTGNALACAAALACLDLFEKNDVLSKMQPNIEMVSEYFKRFKQYDFIGDTRHVGFAGGIEIVKDKQTKMSFDYTDQIGAKVCYALRDKGVMIRPLGDVIVFMPAVAMDSETLKELLETMDDVLKNDLPGIVG